MFIMKGFEPWCAGSDPFLSESLNLEGQAGVGQPLDPGDPGLPLAGSWWAELQVVAWG